jgi:hypothetical protein
VYYADAKCILLEDRGNEEGQIQHQIGRHGGMQCLLCDGIRIFSEAFQTTESGTRSVRASGSRTWEHVQFEGASADVGSQREFIAFVGDAGCIQPHCQVQKKVDNSKVPLILFTSRKRGHKQLQERLGSEL